MIEKLPIYPQRVRKVPAQFSRLDHRLVRDHHLDRCSHPAATLYLFLVTVADSQGLSYYSDPSVSRRLAMDQLTLNDARENLIRLGLIAYQLPLYQVLPLDPEPPVFADKPRTALDHPISLGRIFKQIAGDLS